ncbi:hypothetical protein GUJ93_ZPchr0006g41069 [Zizania palustris]|uniref:Uncharacterized protein n=1 Tax=Zizania palustris TaxID=103762 RepID=A0A8J5T3M1_ZIZPA|nr:hypothetical protein GUJ93_ZPchr0006g41069 [Zizania palustris]
MLARVSGCPLLLPKPLIVTEAFASVVGSRFDAMPRKTSAYHHPYTTPQKPSVAMPLSPPPPRDAVEAIRAAASSRLRAEGLPLTVRCVGASIVKSCKSYRKVSEGSFLKGGKSLLLPYYPILSQRGSVHG